MSDPRTLLDKAAQQRQPLKLRSKAGEWVSARVVRVEKGGVVVALEKPRFTSGEDLRAWISVDGTPYTFSASVLRDGVPIPDRSRAGLLLGYLEGFEEGRPEPRSKGSAKTNSAQIEVLPAAGRGLRLLGGDVRLVELSVKQLAFAVPQRIALKFVEGSSVRVRMRTEQGVVCVAEGEIRRLVRDEGHYLYGLHFTQVQDPALHLQVVSALVR
ncbi:MAG: hypothetical protein VX899_00825 [Myxococcota bacterium]|nr:hypothetical protein [Myxococcota bacterium]